MQYSSHNRRHLTKLQLNATLMPPVGRGHNVSVDLTWANLGAVGGSGSTRASEHRAKTIALTRVTARQLNPLYVSQGQ